jgi:cellulose synthase (UDP-forming)
VQFELPISVERDLLIRKIFTGGATTVQTNSASAITVTLAMLQRIWAMKPSAAPHAQADAPAPDEARLPKQTFVIQPQQARLRLDVLAAQRASLAA